MLDMTNTDNLLASLKADKSSADAHKSLWDDRREVWIKENNGDPYGNEVKGKSTIVDRSIKKSEVWQHATIIDPFVSNTDMVRATAITAEDEGIAEQSERLLNHFFCRDFDRYNFVSEGFKIAQREGTVIARVGWEFEEREVEVEVPIIENVQVMTPQGPMMQQQVVGMRKEMQMRTVINKPTAANRDNRTLWIDPTEKYNIGKAQFAIEHFKSSLSQLKSEGIYENLDDVSVPTNTYEHEDEESYDDEDDYSFTFKDKARKELDVYEYWGNYDVDGDGIAEAIVCTWIGDTIIRLEENPYPDQEVPFVSYATEPEPFSINGRPNADLQGTDQKIQTSVLRSVMDTLDSSTNGQRGYQEGTLDPANERKFKSHKDFKFRGEKPNFWEGKHADINPSIINFYEMTKRNQTELTGIQPFGVSQGSYGSATQAQGAMNAVGQLEVNISRGLAENFILPLLRKWLSMANEFMEPEEVERITGMPYVKPDPADMSGTIDIRIEVNTAASDHAKGSELSFMLQTMGNTLPFDLTKILLSEQAELKKMPGLAKQILEFQPQPDPFEQQMKQLQMQELQASIAEKQSRAAENQIDMRLKEAKAVLEEAKARQIHGMADDNELSYVRKANGQDQADAIEMENVKARNKIIEERSKPQKTGE